METAQTSLKRFLNVHRDPLNTTKVLERKTSRSSITKEFTGTYEPKLTLSFSKENFSPSLSQESLKSQNILLQDDHLKAENCLSTIDDPLWKHVCRDVISMMGAASFLKIWESTLGDVCLQDESMEIKCKTEETAQFIQQYDFVILESLKPYLPALKQLRVKSISG